MSALRGGFIPRGGIDEVDYYSIYPTNRLLPSGEDWLMLYDGGNGKHNRQLPEGVTEQRRAIMVARLPNRRIAGLRATDRVAMYNASMHSCLKSFGYQIHAPAT